MLLLLLLLLLALQLLLMFLHQLVLKGELEKEIIRSSNSLLDYFDIHFNKG